MSSTSLSILAIFLLGTASASDRIDQIVSATTGGPLWENGAYPIVDLPGSAPINVVVAKVLQMTGWAKKGARYKIVEVKKVHITGSLPDLYTAVLLKTDVGDRIVLLQHSGNAPGSWWSRVLADK